MHFIFCAGGASHWGKWLPGWERGPEGSLGPTGGGTAQCGQSKSFFPSAMPDGVAPPFRGDRSRAGHTDCICAAGLGKRGAAVLHGALLVSWEQ